MGLKSLEALLKRYENLEWPVEKRRRPLLKRMDEVAEEGRNCQRCRGTCCTFVANSMQVTPLEALDIYQYLKGSELWSEKLVNLLNQTVKDYRLDYDIPLRKGVNLRRTYTCPFFADGPYGCSLPREVKPYGCLGFNPGRAGVSQGGDCYSEKDYLEKREEVGEYLGESEMNSLLKKILDLSWEKLDIPRALLEIDRAFEKLGPQF